MFNKSKSLCVKTVYLDNNGTTVICDTAAKAHSEWLRCFNASSDSRIARPFRQVLERVETMILQHVTKRGKNNPDQFTVLFTSGGTESNCFIIRACVRAFKRKAKLIKNILPHIVSSQYEHHSILDCLQSLEEDGDIELTLVRPNVYGVVSPESVDAAMKPNTCLVTIMHGNNEVPAINDIAAIGAVVKARGVPFHSDCVQTFGKYLCDLSNVDAVSASAHKFYGPKGIGLLVLRKELIEGYGITAEINGTQQHHLRGGTENVPAIVAMCAALQDTFVHREQKNKKLLHLKVATMQLVAETYPIVEFEGEATRIETKKYAAGTPVVLFLGARLGPDTPPNEYKNKLVLNELPNTILMSIVKTKGEPFCNILLKKYLDEHNVVISIGSACLTASASASHVLAALGAPAIVRRGVIRISFGDNNTVDDVAAFVHFLKLGIAAQC